MPRYLATLPGLLVLAGAGFVLVGGTAAHPVAGPAVPPCFQEVISPNPDTFDNLLYGVAAVGTNDVWAVGYYDNNSGYQTLVEHWNGSAWSIVPSPSPSGKFLRGVAAVSTNDVWAVGDYDNGSNFQALMEHWNGTAWSVVPSPSPGIYYNEPQGVAAVSASDVWVVGDYNNGSGDQTLIEHWNGTAWSVIPSPNPGTNYSYLYGVAAVSPNNVWAVGHYRSPSGSDQTLVEHWNGTAWSIVASPNYGADPDSSYLQGLAAVSASDVWAVGNYIYFPSGANWQTLVEHWDGSTWAIVSSPNPNAGDDTLQGVAAVSASDVWAVGTAGAGTLVEHWDGSAWSVVPSPNPSTTQSPLTGVAAVSASDVWAVGFYLIGNGNQTLILHSCPPLLTSTPTVTGTPPPNTPTPTSPPTATGTPPPNTPTPTSPPTATQTPTNTPLPTQTPGGPTATPAPCTISFSDVQPTDYFYTPVRYLYCHGVISGYADGTFRPYTNTTRGQMVKIVVLGFNKTITTPAGGNYTFSDVPRTFPFFAYIETGAALSIVSGYVCGQPPAGPCDAQNRPYFLPYNYVTRGQLSKIDVGAAGWALLNPATRTFEDVLPGTAFYPFVETAAARGVVSGYACGPPPAGACVPPGNRSYFRPGNLATRGQISKIVYLSILSGP